MVLDLTRLDLDSRVIVPCARRLRPHFVFRSVVLLEVCFLSSCWCLVGGCQVSRSCPVCKGKFFFLLLSSCLLDHQYLGFWVLLLWSYFNLRGRLRATENHVQPYLYRVQWQACYFWCNKMQYLSIWCLWWLLRRLRRRLFRQESAEAANKVSQELEAGEAKEINTRGKIARAQAARAKVCAVPCRTAMATVNPVTRRSTSS